MTQTPTTANAPLTAPVGRKRPTMQQLQLVTLAWVFGSFWMYIVSGIAFTQFVRGLGQPDSRFGTIAALPFVATFVQLGVSYILERYGRRKLIFLLSLTFARVMWAVIALIPWVVPEHVDLYWYALFTALLMSWLGNAIGGPAWMNWMADVIPRRLRGRYMAVRNSVTRPIGLIVGLGVGLLLDMVEQDASAGPSAMLHLTSLMLLAASVFGTADILCFIWVKDPQTHVRPERRNWFSQIGAALRDGDFRLFLTYHGLLVLGIGFIGPFVWLFVIDVAQVKNWQASVMLTVLPLMIQIFSYGFWGRLMDRIGKRRVLIMAGTLFIFGPFGWLISGPDNWMLGYLLTAISPFAFPGVELATFNTMLDLSGGTKERGDRGSTVHVALNSIAAATGGVLSGLLAWWFTTNFADHQPVYESGTVPWTYHKTLFVLSMVLRVAAFACAWRLADHRHFAARTIMQHTVSSFYGNLRQVVAWPSQAVGTVRRWTFRSNPDA